MAGWFRALIQGLADSGPALPPQASLGATCATLHVSGQVHRVHGVVSVELDAFPPTQTTARFPGDHTSERFSHPPQAECPVKNQELGWGRGPGHCSAPVGGLSQGLSLFLTPSHLESGHAVPFSPPDFCLLSQWVYCRHSTWTRGPRWASLT